MLHIYSQLNIQFTYDNSICR